MNRERAARAYDLIAEGFAELAIAVRDIDTPAARAGGAGVEGMDRARSSPPPATSVVPAAVVPPAAAGAFPSFDELPPEGFEGPLPTLKEQHVNMVLSQCPDHQVAWTVKPAGVSKNGKPYGSFWRCAQRNGETWCAKKPVKAWVDSHPIQEGAAA